MRNRPGDAGDWETGGKAFTPCPSPSPPVPQSPSLLLSAPGCPAGDDLLRSAGQGESTGGDILRDGRARAAVDVAVREHDDAGLENRVRHPCERVDLAAFAQDCLSLEGNEGMDDDIRLHFDQRADTRRRRVHDRGARVEHPLERPPPGYL